MSNKFSLKPPSINKRVACICPDPILGAVISSYFNNDDEYFCILEAPRMERPDFTNEIYRKNNSLMRIKPEKVILAGLDENAVMAFTQMLGANRIILIPSLNQVEAEISKIIDTYPIDELACRSNDLARGLLLAKYLKKKLRIIDSAKLIEDDLFPQSEHKVFLDDINDLCPVIAANYSHSINATLNTLPPVSEKEMRTYYEYISESRKFRNTTRGEDALKNLNLNVSSFENYILEQSSEIKFITFITVGIPYGYLSPEIPSTHLFSYPDLGVQILSDLAYSNDVVVTRSALVIDPDEIKNVNGEAIPTETDFVTDNLLSKGLYVREIRNNQAKTYIVGQYIENFPYDLLFICSHAGEITGDQLTIKFLDRYGKEHEIILQKAHSSSLTGEGEGNQSIVQVQDFTGFVSLDGVDWDDKEGKKAINSKEVIEDFWKIPYEYLNIVSKKEIDVVRYCVAIKMKDSWFQPMFHSIADIKTPIIFINACVSFYDFSRRFMFAGARAYIGTLTQVNTDFARKFAEKFFDGLSTSKPLPILLWEIQRDLCTDPKDRVYVHVGTHFTNILPPSGNTKEFVENSIINSIARRSKKLESKQPLSEDVRRNLEQDNLFSKEELKKFS